MTRSDVDDLVSDLASALCQGRARNDSIFIATAVTYPNGVGVTVRIDATETGYCVSDDGYAEVIAEDMGALAALHRIASGVADRSGVSYDRGAFLVRDVDRATLHVAVTLVANASSRALERLVAGLETPRLKKSRDVFDKRLRDAFGDDVMFDVEIQGATGRRWDFSAGIGKKGVFNRLFELVSPSTQAVALANMKISDTRALVDPPSVTAALIDYERTEPALRSILSNAGGLVIAANDDIAKYRIVG